VNWNRSIAIGGIVALSTSLLLARAHPFGDAGEAARGKDVFERRCTGCHSLDQNREGPRLRGVFGRVSGSVSDFAYSPAIKQARITWNENTLERWLADPDIFIPGNNMDFRVAKPQERSDLIRFLKDSADR
jgi:cytochrome c